MDLEVLKDVRDRILKYPDNFDMADYLTYSSSCGTIGCIATTAVICKHLKTHKTTIGLKLRGIAGGAGAKALGLGEDDNSWVYLFYEHNWPLKYKNKYMTAKSSRGRARVAANLISSIIKKGKIWWNI